MSLTIADNNDTNAFLRDQENIGPFQQFFNKIVSGSYPKVLGFSKFGIIAGSVVSGIAGWILLGFCGRSSQTPAFDKSIASGERL